MNGVELIREISHPQQAIWDLMDKASSKAGSPHRLEWFFHFAPGIEILLGEKQHSLVKNSKIIGTISAPENGVRVETKSTWFSYEYGAKVPNVQMHAVWEGSLNENGTNFFWHFQFVPSNAALTGETNAETA